MASKHLGGSASKPQPFALPVTQLVPNSSTVATNSPASMA